MDNIKDTEIQHILVIDDDERLRLLLRRFLEESGFRVTDVASAADARRLLAADDFGPAQPIKRDRRLIVFAI